MTNAILRQKITYANTFYIFFYYIFLMKPKYAKLKNDVT